MEDFLCNLARDRDILDIGYGDGKFAIRMADECRSVIAFESNKKKIMQSDKTNIVLFHREMKSIDDIISNMLDVAICRISVNGNEGDLLMSAFEMIRRYRPIMIVRIGHKLNRSSYDVGKILFDLNYMYPIPFDTHYVYFPFCECLLLKQIYTQGKSIWRIQTDERNHYANEFRIFTISDTRIRILFGDVIRTGIVSEDRIVFDNGITWLAK